MANDKAAEAPDLAVMSDQTDTGELAPSKLGTKDQYAPATISKTRVTSPR